MAQHFPAVRPAVKAASPRSAAKQSAHQACRSFLDLKDRTKTSNRPNYPCTADAKEEAASSKDLRLLRCKRLGLLHQSSHLSHALWKSVRCCTRTTKRGQNFRPHQHRPCLRALRHVQRSVHPAHHHRRANRCTHLLQMQISSRTWPSLSVIRSRRCCKMICLLWFMRCPTQTFYKHIHGVIEWSEKVNCVLGVSGH